MKKVHKEITVSEQKTKDLWVLQGKYGYGDGWEDLTAEESHSEIRQRLREYRENEPGTSLRIRRRGLRGVGDN